MTATRLALWLPALLWTGLAHAQGAEDGLPTLGSAPTPDRFAAMALDPDLDFDTRHKACLRAIASDPERAYETALTWKGRGGGFRAEHCTAMALFTLGHDGEAARRLEALSAHFPDTDPDTRRRKADYLSEAAQGWLQAGEPHKAWEAASAALDLEPSDALARITRARVYFALDQIDDAETDLTTALAYHPDHAEALRYRADARLRLGRFDAAMADAEESLALAPSVDTALIRGHIREAKAKGAATPE